MAYDFTLSELEASDEFSQSSPEVQRAIAREYISQNGTDEVLNQFKTAVSDPEYQALPVEQQDLFRRSYADFYGVNLPLEDVSFGTDVKDVVMSGLAGTSAIPKAAATVAGWFGAEDSKQSLLDIARTTEDFYKSRISKQGREVEQQPFLSDQDGKWFGDNAVKKVFMVSAESLPLMIATAPIGGAASAGISKAKFLPDFIRAVEGTGDVGKWSHNLVTFGASEAGTSALVSAADAGEKIAKMPYSVIAKSPVYQELLKQGLSADDARAELRGIVEEETVKTQFAATLVFGAAAPGGAMPKLFQKGALKQGVTRETVEGIVKESGQEGLQSPAEQAGENLVTQRNLDPTQSLTENLGEAAALGAASGGLMGGGMGGGSKLLTLGEAQKIATDVPLGADPEQTVAAIEAATGDAAPRITLGELTPDEIEGITAVGQRMSTADLAEIQRVQRDVLPLLREKNPMVAPHVEQIVNERFRALQAQQAVQFEQQVPAVEASVAAMQPDLAADDLMDDWAESEQDVQDQADARGRSVRFEALKQSMADRLTAADELETNRTGAPSTAEESAAVLAAADPTDVEARAVRQGDIEEAFNRVDRGDDLVEQWAESVPERTTGQSRGQVRRILTQKGENPENYDVVEQGDGFAAVPRKQGDTVQTTGNQITPPPAETVDPAPDEGTAPEGNRTVGEEPVGTGTVVKPTFNENDREDRYFGSSVTVSKGKKGEYQGKLQRIVKSSFGDTVYEVQPEGTDTTFRVPEEDLSFDKVVDNSGEPVTVKPEKIELSGKFVPDSKEFNATAEGQKKMASRASRIALLQNLNDKASGTYTRDEIDAVPDGEIDSYRDSLLAAYNQNTAASLPAEEKRGVTSPGASSSRSVPTIAGNLSLAEFERETDPYDPSEVTREDWVNLQRAERRRIGQDEKSGTAAAPYVDYEEYHKERVRAAINKGDSLDKRVLADYPDLVAEFEKEVDQYKRVRSENTEDGTVSYKNVPTRREPESVRSTAPIPQSSARTIPVADSKLETVEEIEDRIQSIDGQLERLEGVRNPKDFNKHTANIAKLNARKDELWNRRAKLNHSIAADQPVNTDPTPAQKEAGNYKKAHVTLDGLNISIENPVGSTRRGQDTSGRAWEQKLAADYGYIRGTRGKDKDHLDIFIKPGYTGGAADVFVVNQYRADGTFDEHKSIVGAADEQEALNLYRSNYEDGWTGGRSVTRVPMETFRKWAAGTGPAAGPLVRRGTYGADGLEDIEGRITAAEKSGVKLSDRDKIAIRTAHQEYVDLSRKASRLSVADPMNKGNAFPMGVGYTKMTKRKEQAIDSSVRKAGEAVTTFNKAKSKRELIESLLTGKGTESDREKQTTKKEENKVVLARKIIGLKKGDKFGGAIVERVNLDKDGYPASVTISGEGIIKGVGDKIDIVRDFYGRDKEGYRRIVDSIRPSQPRDEKPVVSREKGVGETQLQPLLRISMTDAREKVTVITSGPQIKIESTIQKGDKITFTRGGREYTETVLKVMTDGTYQVDVFGIKYIKPEEITHATQRGKRSVDPVPTATVGPEKPKIETPGKTAKIETSIDNAYSQKLLDSMGFESFNSNPTKRPTQSDKRMFSSVAIWNGGISDGSGFLIFEKFVPLELKPLMMNGTEINVSGFDKVVKETAGGPNAQYKGTFTPKDQKDKLLNSAIAKDDGTTAVINEDIYKYLRKKFGEVSFKVLGAEKPLGIFNKKGDHIGVVMPVYQPKLPKKIDYTPVPTEPGGPDGGLDTTLEAPAYHGTSHTVDRFSTDKIGTGEGAQAYGWGLYFASSREVAEFYKKALGRYSDEDIKAAVQYLKDKNISSDPEEDYGYSDDNDYVRLAISSGFEPSGKPGKLYKVELAPQENEYLLWDKPLSEQSEKVRKALRNIGRFFPQDGDSNARKRVLHLDDIMHSNQEKVTGKTVYKELSSRDVLGDQAASEYLHSLGIRGIKYLDGTSRSSGAGAYNYVIFDDTDVTITDILASETTRREFIVQGGALIAWAAAGGDVTALADTRSFNDTLAQPKQTVHGALQHIASNSSSPRFRTMAEDLLTLLPDDGSVTLTVTDTRTNDAGTTTTDRRARSVAITLYGDGHNEATLLHESWHAAVLARYDMLNYYLANPGKLGNHQAEAALKQYRAVWEEFGEAVKAYGRGRDDLPHWLKVPAENPDEFLTYALTNPETIDWMSEREYRGKTLRERFLQAIRGFFARVFRRAPTWLDAANMATGDLIEAMKRDAPNFEASARILELVGKNGSTAVNRADSILYAQAPAPATSTRPDRIDRLNLSDQWERFIYNVIDKDDPRRRVLARADVVNLSENLSENTDILTIERLRGKKTAEEGLRFWEDRVVPLLRKLAGAKLAASDLDEYAHAKHAPERNKRMQQVNAKSYIDRIAEHLNSAERQALDDEIIDIRSDVLMTGGTRADRQDRYLAVLDRLMTGIAAQRADVATQVRNRITNRTFTAAEIAKGTPANIQAELDARTAHLDEIERITDRWNLESPRFAGITDAEAADIVTRWQADPRFQALADAHARLLEFGQMKLNILRESGQLTDVEYQSLVDGYEFYVPLMRDVETDDRPATGRITGPTGSPIKVAKGSMLEVVHILAHSIQNVQTAINRKHKADGGRVLYNFARENPDAGVTIAKQKKEPRHDSEGNVVMFTAPREADNELYVRVDGERYTLTFDTKNATTKRFLESIKEADAGLSGPMQALGKLVRILAMVNTTLAPEFVFTNFTRDIQTAGVHMEDTEAKGLQTRVLKNVFPAIKGILGAEYGKAGTYWGRVYRDFAANGGKIGWMQSYDGIKDLAKQIESTMDLHRDGHYTKKSLRTIADLITRTNTAVENGVRLAVYDQLIKAGATPSRAALVASNLTVDFTRRGAYSPVLNSLYMFFNAGVQGNVRMIKAVARSSRVRAITGGIVLAGFALQFLAYATGGEDDTGEPYIDGIPDFIRERNMIIMYPGTEGKFQKIPMPYGYNLFYNVGVGMARAAHALYNGRKYEPGREAVKLVTMALNSFNPLQAATVTQALSPTVLDPFVMVGENKNWAGMDLMPKESPFGPGKADAYRAWKSTSGVAKSISQGLHRLTGGKGEYDNTAGIDVSPEVLELMYETFTGSAGRFLKDIVVTPIQAITGDEPVDPAKVPFLRRAYGEWSPRAVSNRYYEQAEQVERFRKDFLAADPPERKNLSTDPRYKMVSYTREVENKLDKLREARNKVTDPKRFEEQILKIQTEYLRRSKL